MPSISITRFVKAQFIMLAIITYQVIGGSDQHLSQSRIGTRGTFTMAAGWREFPLN